MNEFNNGGEFNYRYNLESNRRNFQKILNFNFDENND